MEGCVSSRLLTKSPGFPYTSSFLCQVLPIQVFPIQVLPIQVFAIQVLPIQVFLIQVLLFLLVTVQVAPCGPHTPFLWTFFTLLDFSWDARTLRTKGVSHLKSGGCGST